MAGATMTDSVVYHVISLVILARHSSAVHSGAWAGAPWQSIRSQALMCLGLITAGNRLVRRCRAGPRSRHHRYRRRGRSGTLRRGRPERPTAVYAIAAVAVTVVILLVPARVRRNLAIGVGVRFRRPSSWASPQASTSCSTLVVGRPPWWFSVAMSYLGNRASTAWQGQRGNGFVAGPLLATAGTR